MITHLLAAVLTTGLAVGAPPKAADVGLDRAAREYRIQIYGTFRQDRDEYNRRLAEWTRVEAAWIESGSPEAERPELTQWLSAAIDRSQPDLVRSLPAPPSFVLGAELKRQIETCWRDVFPEETWQSIAAETAAMIPAPGAKNVIDDAKSAVEASTPKDTDDNAGNFLSLPFKLPVELLPIIKPAAEKKQPSEVAPTVSANEPEPAEMPAAPADLLQLFGQRVEQGIRDLKAGPAPTGE